jgi:hypothetical protein
VTHALECKLLRKCQKDQVLVGMIASNEMCVDGVFMSWELFLLNQFLIDCTKSHDIGMEFHYSWLLIMIVFATWNEPSDETDYARLGLILEGSYE